jgi:flavin-dependent dehydrogenase
VADVMIIGGGPAGATLGSYLSMAGISNTIIEKAMHPRPHVGESLVPSTTRIFDDIGFLETMELGGFARKYGASWHPTKKRGEMEHGFNFAESPQDGVGQDYTWHVDRSRFDHLLLQHAKQLGSNVIQGIGVRKVLFNDADEATGVRVAINGTEVDLQAKMVIDASGRNTVLGQQRRLRQKDPIFNQFAVHTWFENLDRGDGKSADHIHVYFLPIERGWAWQIPISETITSVGVVAEGKLFKQSRQRIEDYFFEHANMSPDLSKALETAKPVREFKSEADYSYVMSEFVGNRWMLVGDAARFVDPIFSSGVSIALESAKFASQAIIAAFETGDFSREALAPYETKLRSGVGIWYEFIKLYYKLMHLFTFFIRSKEHRLQILQLLQGEVYDRENAPVLDAMRDIIDKVESTPGHLWQEHLTDVPID